MKTIRYYLLGILLLWCAGAAAQQKDSIRFSLLTCEPGQEIYSLFGHTAIRYENFSQSLDYVFNYGMFSFNTPNFVYRFVKGETDYELGVMPYEYFRMEYAARGSSVYQQELNLTHDEQLRLLHLLETNYAPENRTYRYNYFYDNCTTRARDKIEEAIHGKVVYPDAKKNKSFRSIIHEFTVDSKWDELGIDLCLGRAADVPIDGRKQMFAPFYMKHFAAQAYILNDDGTRRPLIKSETKIIDVPRPATTEGFPLSPMACSVLLMCILVGVSVWQYRKRRICVVVDVVAYSIVAIAGCIIAFLFFFSVHPTVDSNWLLLWLNPLPLIWLPVLLLTTKKVWKRLIWDINAVVLTVFIIVALVGTQKFNLSVLPLAFGFWVNALTHYLVYRKE